MDVYRFLSRARVARLATVSPGGKPHIVPVAFAYDGKRIWIALDEKRKSVKPMKLKRVRNIQANPRVALLMDRYIEDWTKLTWVRVDGRARILLRGKGHDAAIRLLREKYAQYREMRIEARPVIEISIKSIVQWQAKEE